MHAAVAAHERGQGVEVGALDLGALAVVQHVGHDLVLRGEVGQHLRVGRVVAALRALEAVGGQAQHVKEDVAELHGGVDVEGLAGGRVDPLGHRGDLGAELGRLRREHACVHGQAHALHLGEHGQKRHLHVVEEPLRPVLSQALAQGGNQVASAHGV